MKKKILVEDMKAKAARYRKFYPEKYTGLDDADVLLAIHVIDQRVANILRGIKEPIAPRIKKAPKINAYGVKMTEAKMKKDMKAAAKDWLADNPEGDVGQVAYDMAASMLTFDMDGYGALLTKMGIEKRNHIEALAEYIA